MNETANGIRYIRLRVLCPKKLVNRKADPNNRRVLRIYITDAGRKEAEKILPQLLNVNDNALAGLTNDEILKSKGKKIYNLLIN